jgi:hypothetical protein
MPTNKVWFGKRHADIVAKIFTNARWNAEVMATRRLSAMDHREFMLNPPSIGIFAPVM